jgi:hypothetical protein
MSEMSGAVLRLMGQFSIGERTLSSSAETDTAEP